MSSEWARTDAGRAYHREYARRWAAAHPDAARAADRKYKNANRDEINAKRREILTPDHHRTNYLRHYHGMTPDDFARMWDERHGCCYLCGREMKLESHQQETATIDHDHEHCPEVKGKSKSCAICRRGLACDRCNRLIGMAEDDPELLRYIADSLEQRKAEIAPRLAAAPVQEELFEEVMGDG